METVKWFPWRATAYQILQRMYSLHIVNSVRFQATASCVHRVRFSDRDSRWTRLPLIKATRPSVRLPRESRRGINSDGAGRTPPSHLCSRAAPLEFSRAAAMENRRVLGILDSANGVVESPVLVDGRRSALSVVVESRSSPRAGRRVRRRVESPEKDVVELPDSITQDSELAPDSMEMEMVPDSLPPDSIMQLSEAFVCRSCGQRPNFFLKKQPSPERACQTSLAKTRAKAKTWSKERANFQNLTQSTHRRGRTVPCKAMQKYLCQKRLTKRDRKDFLSLFSLWLDNIYQI